MGFFNRLRKKAEHSSAHTPASGRAETMNEQSSGTGAAEGIAAAAKAEAPRSEALSPDNSAPIVAAPQIKEVSVEELKSRIDAGTAPMLIDVREPWEHQIAHINMAELIPMNSIPAKIAELDKDAEIVVHCHHGQRSWNVAAYMAQHGFTNVKNLTGGIDSWARRIDKSMRTY